MKNLIIFFLFFLSLRLFSQEVIDLIIPSDYKELEKAFIEVFTLYIESEAALEESVQNFKNLKIEYDKINILYKESEQDNKKLQSIINPVIVDLENQIIILTKELKKGLRSKPLELFGGLSLSNRIIPDVKIGAFLNFVLFEKISIQVEYRFLDEYSLGIGYKF